MADTLRVPRPERPPERRQVGVVNLDRSVEEVAREKAEEALTRYTAEASQGGFLKKVWNSVVTQNLFREYYRERAVSQARAEILRDRSLYGGGATGRQAQSAAEKALAEYLVAAGVKDLEAKTETKAFLGQSEAELAVKKTLEDQVAAAAADPTLTREAFEDNIRPSLLKAFDAYNQAAAQSKRATLATPNTLLATNLWDVVADLRALRGHNVGVQTVRRELDICLGELRHAARTETEESQTEKILNLLNKRVGLGSALVNETGVGAAIALGVSGVSTVGQSLGTKLAFFAGGLLGSSAVGAKLAHYREGRRLDRERWLHDRQVAQGQHVPEREADTVRQAREAKIASLEQQRSALKPWQFLQKRALDHELATLALHQGNRREAFSAVSVESASVTEATRILRDFYTQPADIFEQSDNLERLQAILIDLDARANVSISARRDFLRFSADSTVAEQRTAFLKLRSQVRARLEAAVSGDEAKRRAWKTDYGIALTQAQGRLLRQIEEQDGQYQKYRGLVQELVAKRAAVAGLLVGGVVQTLAGLVSDKITSPLEAAWQYLTGPRGGGAPTPEVQAALDSATENFKQLPTPPAEVCDLTLETTPPPSPLETTPVVRDAYYVNAQPTLVDSSTGRVVGGSDLNELRFRWGGERGVTTLPSGEKAFVLDISGMKDSESWNGGFRTPDGRVVYSLPTADQGLALEQLTSPKVAISSAIKDQQAVILLVPDGANRNEALVLPVDATTGQATVPFSSPLAELFKVQNGQAHFRGFRVEAAIMTGSDKGTVHVGVLSAFKGDQSAATLAPNLGYSELPIPAAESGLHAPETFGQSALESVTVSSPDAQESSSDLPVSLPITGREGLALATPKKSVRQVRTRTIPTSPPLPPPPVPDIAPPMLIGEGAPVNLAGQPADFEVGGLEIDSQSPLEVSELTEPVSSEKSQGEAFIDVARQTPGSDISALYQAAFGHPLAEHPYNYQADIAAIQSLCADLEERGVAADNSVNRAYEHLLTHLSSTYETRRVAAAVAASEHLRQLNGLDGVSLQSFQPSEAWLTAADRALAALEDGDEAPQAVATWRHRLDTLRARPPQVEKPAASRTEKFADQPDLRFLNTLDVTAWPETPAGMDQLLGALNLERLRSGALPTQNLRRRFDVLDKAVRKASLRYGDRRRLVKKLKDLHEYISRGVEREMALSDLERFGRLGARWLAMAPEERQDFLAAATREDVRSDLIRPIVETLGLRGSTENMKAQLGDMLRLGTGYRAAVTTYTSWGDREQTQITAGLELAQAALNPPPLPETQPEAVSPTEGSPAAEVVFEPASDDVIISHLERALGLDPDQNAADLWQTVGETFNMLFERFDDHPTLVESLSRAPSNTQLKKIKTKILSRLNGELDRLLPATTSDEQGTVIRQVFDDYFDAYTNQLRNL